MDKLEQAKRITKPEGKARLFAKNNACLYAGYQNPREPEVSFFLF